MNEKTIILIHEIVFENVVCKWLPFWGNFWASEQIKYGGDCQYSNIPEANITITYSLQTSFHLIIFHNQKIEWISENDMIITYKYYYNDILKLI